MNLYRRTKLGVCAGKVQFKTSKQLLFSFFIDVTTVEVHLIDIFLHQHLVFLPQETSSSRYQQNDPLRNNYSKCKTITHKSSS